MLYPQPVSMASGDCTQQNNLANDYHSLSLTNNQQLKLPLKAWKWPCLSPRPKFWHGIAFSIVCGLYWKVWARDKTWFSLRLHLLTAFPAGVTAQMYYSQSEKYCCRTEPWKRERNECNACIYLLKLCCDQGVVRQQLQTSDDRTHPSRLSQCELSCITWPL